MSSSLPISVCMIVKNEESFLDAALNSVLSVLNPDEIVVADTGSTDGTVDIVLAHGAKLVHFPWCDDFSAARNFSADCAKNDWLLVLDADEEIVSVDFSALETFLSDELAVGAINMVEMSSKGTSSLSRLYNRKYHHFSGIIHEQIVPIGDFQKTIKAIPIDIIHYGYSQEVKEAKGKLERNERLLRKELESSPGDSYLLYQLGKCFFDSSRDLPQACIYFEQALAASLDFRLDYVYALVECYGYALINTGQYEKALEFLLEHYERYSSKAQFRFLTAHALQNNGMFVEAVEQYESCIGADITDYSGITSYLSYYNIGVVLECVGMEEDAIEMYKKCDEYEPAALRLKELIK
ncbi:MAG: glycosyltransferase [Oscillospiraceae bacterium]|nr:glycosyltransferase [Oscillospiraceae bacterium]